MSVSAEVDERTLREIYLPAFEAAVKDADVGTVMCSYNRINGVYASEDPWLLTSVLRDEWGFDGWVLTDYGAQHSTAAAANGGTDMELPYHQFYDQRLLSAAVRGGRCRSRRRCGGDVGIDRQGQRRVPRGREGKARSHRGEPLGLLRQRPHRRLPQRRDARAVGEVALSCLVRGG